jgi:hypothetical protein
LGFEIKAATTSPDPIPIKMDATKNNADVLRNINPTPTPISVVPPMAHELLSLLWSTSNSSSNYLISPQSRKGRKHNYSFYLPLRGPAEAVCKQRPIKN